MKVLTLTPADDIQKAINELMGPAVVHLKKGVYRQKLEICADNITLEGEDEQDTVITYDDYARKIHADGREYNTFRTYTLCVTGNNVKLKNLTVENSNTDPKTNGQCVALSVHGKLFKAESVTLKSTQDTLFLSPFPDDLVIRYSGLTDDETYYDGFILRRQLYGEGENLHLFENCKIYGTVDFIFGCAEAYFKNCEIISIADNRNIGFIAAPAHSLKQEGGFYFIDCDIKNGGAEQSSCYLARPWRDFGKCAFINCKVGNHIKGVLFDKWNDTYRDKTARFYYYNLDCAFIPAPVGWAKELDENQANYIIDKCGAKFKRFKV
ncbi:MAG: pectin esterase [Clostridia bacterium]|nr:pectin esterase [Clostridia bacterium]